LVILILFVPPGLQPLGVGEAPFEPLYQPFPGWGGASPSRNPIRQTQPSPDEVWATPAMLAEHSSTNPQPPVTSWRQSGFGDGQIVASTFLKRAAGKLTARKARRAARHDFSRVHSRSSPPRGRREFAPEPPCSRGTPPRGILARQLLYRGRLLAPVDGPPRRPRRRQQKDPFSPAPSAGRVADK
jgi:hypothetical protein